MAKQIKPKVFSGIQPSGALHLGNYLGAMAQWVGMQATHDCVFCVVDYHAITVRQDPAELKKKILEVAKLYLAAGIDPKKSIIFQQSDVSAHTELAWILNTIARMSDLYKMTQFKDKAGVIEEKNFIVKIISLLENSINYKSKVKENLENIINTKEFITKIEKIKNSVLCILEAEKENKRIIKKFINNFATNQQKEKAFVGLFDYPVLMAADILLYDTDVVPVGEDQKQHVELARDLAKRFNHHFGETFRVPDVKLLKTGARIMGLDDPAKKMSKSAKSEYNYVALTDKPAAAAKKIMRAATDSGMEIKYDPEKKPGISNLLAIYSLLAGREIKELEKSYAGRGYGDFKKDLAGEVEKFLAAFQSKLDNISDKETRAILDRGAEAARERAEKILKRVKEKIGVN